MANQIASMAGGGGDPRLSKQLTQLILLILWLTIVRYG
jgi:hypothetical protein